MRNTTLSDHASVRMQQRGIPPDVFECLLEYGRFDYVHRGDSIVNCDKVELIAVK